MSKFSPKIIQVTRKVAEDQVFYNDFFKLTSFRRAVSNKTEGFNYILECEVQGFFYKSNINLTTARDLIKTFLTAIRRVQ